MTYLFIAIIAMTFSIICWRKFDLALAIFFALLPSYVIRFNIGPLPSTLLELMIWIIVVVWVIRSFVIPTGATTQERSGGIFLTIKESIANGKIPPLRSLACGLTHFGRNDKNYSTEKNVIHTTHKLKIGNSLFIASTLFLIGATISIFTGVSLRAAAGEWRAFYAEPFLIFLVLVTTIKTKKQLQQILFGLMIGALATALLAIYQHFTGFLVPHSFWANRATYRVTAWYGYPNAVGLFLAPILPLAVYFIIDLWKEQRSTQQKISPFIALSLCIAMLFIPSALLALAFAKGFGPITAACLGTGITLLYFKKFRIPAIILALACVAALIYLPMRNSATELALKQRSAHIRSDMWAETTEYLSEHPIVGTGLASYATRITPYRIDKTIEVFSLPHNLFLSIWVNTGIIGLFGFLWIIAWFYRIVLTNLIKNGALNLPILCLCGAMTAIILMGCIDTPYIKNDLAIEFWLIIAAAFFIQKNNVAAITSIDK